VCGQAAAAALQEQLRECEQKNTLLDVCESKRRAAEEETKTIREQNHTPVPVLNSTAAAAAVEAFHKQTGFVTLASLDAKAVVETFWRHKPPFKHREVSQSVSPAA
jgi:hypothetical protein